MKFISLFAGVGGFDLGFEKSGMTCVGQVEIDKNARKILEKHWPDVPKHDDVRTAKEWANEQGFVGNVDVVCGGFPCQDLSVAGKRAGLAGERSGLFHDALAFATHVKAKIIILENVAGLLSSNAGRDFGTVLVELANAGYSNIEWRLLDSQFFGVPQRRRRVFIVASLGTGSFKPILVERKGGSGDFTPSRTQRKKTTESAADGSTTSGIIGSDIVGTLQASDYKFPQQQQVMENKLIVYGQSSFGGYSDGVATITATSYKRPEDNVVLFSPRYDEAVRMHDPETAPTIAANYGTGGGNVPCVIYQLQGTMIGRNHNAGPGGKGFRDDSYPMYTLETVSTHVIAKDQMVRRLTPKECERLQGFPDDWTAEQSDSNRYKQMGNAVTVNVIEWIGKRVMEAING